MIKYVLLALISFSCFSNDDFIYLGHNCVRVDNEHLPISHKKFSEHVEDVADVVFSFGTKKPKRKYENRPMRDALRHLRNPDRDWKTKYHFEKDYLSSSGYQSDGFLQFWKEAGIVIERETCHLGFVGVGLENQKTDGPVLLTIPGSEGYITVEPLSSCLFYLKAPSRRSRTVLQVYTQGSPHNVYQKVYHNNNMHGDFLKANYLDRRYEGDMIPMDWFHPSSWEWYAKYILKR